MKHLFRISMSVIMMFGRFFHKCFRTSAILSLALLLCSTGCATTEKPLYGTDVGTDNYFVMSNSCVGWVTDALTGIKVNVSGKAVPEHTIYLQYAEDAFDARYVIAPAQKNKRKSGVVYSFRKVKETVIPQTGELIYPCWSFYESEYDQQIKNLGLPYKTTLRILIDNIEDSDIVYFYAVTIRATRHDDAHMKGLMREIVSVINANIDEANAAEEKN